MRRLTKLLLIANVFACCSCSVRSFYPLAGSVVGGSAGAIGGPVTAGLGAGAGWAAGEIAKGNKDLEEAQETINALTTGDVDKLVQKKLEDARDDGFFDGILDEVYGLLKLGVIGLALWIVVPLLYTRHVHKKQKENNGSNT
jgi:hypothetical protein